MNTLLHDRNSLTFTTTAQAKRDSNLSYIGSTNSSPKVIKGRKLNYDTYIVYLSPAKSSGYQVCAGASPECIASCLHTAGNPVYLNAKLNARLLKTKLYFEQREMYCAWLFDEVTKAYHKAMRKGHKFAVRLNGTSDISPVMFKHNGQNILEYLNALDEDIMIYDYTKIATRMELAVKYNYSLTYSYSGHNWKECREWLDAGFNVAVVFDNKHALPTAFDGFKVIDGDETDLRPLDEQGVIVGLKFKRTTNFTKLTPAEREQFYVENAFIINA